MSLSTKAFVLLSLFNILNKSTVLCGDYYIAPIETCSTSETPCLTLSDLAYNLSNYVTANMTLVFLGENHTLEVPFVVSDVSHFSMILANGTNISSIMCSEDANFTFLNVNRIHISGLTFTACGGNTVDSVNELTIEHSNFQGQKQSRSALIIAESNVVIIGTSFVLNEFGSYTSLRFFESTGVNPLSKTARVGGALVANHSNISIDNCCFEANKANVGGAIFSEFNSSINISNSVFTSNQATDCNNQLCFGGSLFVNHGVSMYLHNCTFDNNTSKGYGGVGASFNGTIVMSQSSIRANVAFRSGGAVALFYQSSILVHNNSMFENNTAREYGGIVYAQNASSAVLDNSLFTRNSATDFGGTVYATMESRVIYTGNCTLTSNSAKSGGVLYATDNTNVTIINSNFNSNKADSDDRSIILSEGGVAYLNNKSSIFVQGSNFNLNSAASGGGVIAITQSDEDLVSSIVNSTFISNTADDYGGVIHLRYSCSIHIHDSMFINNNVTINGGVVDAYINCAVEIYQSTFYNNSADRDGGVTAAIRNSTLLAERSNFHNNFGVNLGGALYSFESSPITIRKCNFSANVANFGGAIAAKRNGIITVQNSTFFDNHAIMDASVLFARSKCVITISESSFYDNSASNDGTLTASDITTVILDWCEFSGNSAGHDGGVVYVYDNSNLQISCCTITNNSANDSAGAVYVRQNTTLKMNATEISYCTAENYGGGVYLQQDSHAIIEGSWLIHNSATFGGALHVYVRSNANITDSQFSENSVGIGGGAVMVIANSAVKAQKTNFTFNLGAFGAALFGFRDTIIRFEDCYIFENSGEYDGVIRVRRRSVVNVVGTHFKMNTAAVGGVLNFENCNVTVESSTFDQNCAQETGGAIHAFSNSTLSIIYSNFTKNLAKNDGGVINLLSGSEATVVSCHFSSNEAESNGGIVGIKESCINITDCVFNSSVAGSTGGIVHAINSTVDINNSTFTNNTAHGNGGIIDAREATTVIIMSSVFVQNAAGISGGAVHLDNSNIIACNSTFRQNQAGELGGVISANVKSNATVVHSILNSNSADKGGVFTGLQGSQISLGTLNISSICINQGPTNDRIQIQNNTAIYGGGIYSVDSAIVFEEEAKLSYNQANESGGSIHAFNSTISIRSTIAFLSNKAIEKYGGAINVIDSLIEASGTVQFNSNQAKSGGGISFENSTLDTGPNFSAVAELSFTLNKANFGGALFVNDESESSLCSSDPLYSNVSQCFIQDNLPVNFHNNSATIGGDNLFGGLLDRCKVITTTNLSMEGKARAVNSNLLEITNIRNPSTVSSKPVRVCLCNGDLVDCSHRIYNISITIGDTFVLPLAAVDQVEHPVIATVILSSRNNLTLSENQRVQGIDAVCSNLRYQVFFPNTSQQYTLSIHANGPCNSKGLSKLTVNVHVNDCFCGIGFMQDTSSMRCSCVCDTQDKLFSSYVQECDPDTESIVRNGNFWISALETDANTSYQQYFIHPFCPSDYCKLPSESVLVNLNLPNGSDSQCANNRAGFLCSKCMSNYSLSLGSSKCLECPNNWYAQLVVIILGAFIAGIVVVVLILVLNLTVAVGSLNSIIFYANILDANRSIYFSRMHLDAAKVFISWLNLDIGIDTCFYEGMDTYAKTWLELVFPVYLIFLVISIIGISSRSSKFSNLLGKRNPVATLATLILISYTKLLQVIIAAFSFAPLSFPNGTMTIRWLLDASIAYSEGKLIVLFSVASLILIVGLIFTIFIFSWQLLLLCPRLKLLKWIRNHKLHSFIDTYHTPHTPKHRYWIGLLLLVRVILYLISAFTVSIDPRITLIFTIVTVCSLYLYKTAFMVKVYKNRLLNAMESFTHFNIACFAIISWYTFNDSGKTSKVIEVLQVIAAYTSVGLQFCLFLVVIIYHVYRYGSAKMYKLCVRMGKRITRRSDKTGEIWAPSDSKIFDAIDNQRKYVPPLFSVYRPVRSESSSATAATTQQTQETENEGLGEDTTRSLEKSHSLRNSSVSRTAFQVTNYQTRASRNAMDSSDSIVEPLLEEDNL